MKLIKKNLKWITLVFVMIIVMGGILIKYSLSMKKTNDIVLEELELKEEETKDEAIQTVEDEELLKNVYVDIKGAVQNPGVYEVQEDKKVIDVVEMAGGFTEKADTSMINLAKKVANEMVIIIYTIDEVKKANETETVVKIIEKECVCPEIKNDACLNSSDNKSDDKKDDEANSSEAMSRKVNLNTADLKELQTLSGIGESKAEAIIKYREENGNFEKIEDLMNVTGIGEALYEKIKDNITI